MKSINRKSSVLIAVLLCALIFGNFFTVFASANETHLADRFVPEGAYTYNGHSYMFYCGKLNWHQAKKFCEDLGGHLVTVTSAGEWSFIKNKAMQKEKHFWLGATDEKNDSQWEWITGEQWAFTAWSDDYPNDYYSDANYLYISSTRDYMWYNWTSEWDDNAKEGFICEWDFVVDKPGKIFIPEDVYTFNEHQYKFYQCSMTWHEAKEFCESLGGHLAVITSEEEWNFIRDKAAANTGHFWLGATDEELEGNWKWVTEEQWEFTAWSNEYPNTDSNADYLYISYTRDYTWFNWSNDMGEDGFICEWDYSCKSDNGYFTSHDWTDWTVIKEATCDTPGVKSRTCRQCETTETASIAKLTHKYGEITVLSGSKLIPPIVKERECSLCGNVEKIKDWSFVWLPIVCVVSIGFGVFGMINYVRIVKKATKEDEE